MLVQINSDVKSYSESLSTLKFAERVSGVELGVAKSTKDGRDVRELMEQVINFVKLIKLYIFHHICLKCYIIFIKLLITHNIFGKKLYLTLQVASLKDTISTKDEEIERLQLLKDLKNVSNTEKLED